MKPLAYSLGGLKSSIKRYFTLTRHKSSNIFSFLVSFKPKEEYKWQREVYKF